ncbi:MAG TPA: hypothetical protein VNJ04_13850 [Gemmatimonadaceae bacterium]|nr:hypothetical protein [Gemmatimonadaceae bacterium]
MPENKRYRVRKTDADGRPVGALSYPTDPDVEAKLRKAGVAGGEAARVAREEAEAAGQIKTVKAGDYCDDVPVKSLTWLLAQKMVEQVEETVNLQEPRKDT